MAQQGKLRIALDDRADALELVRTELYEATGLTPQAEFQEIDRRGELVVEVRLDDLEDTDHADGVALTDLVKMVSAGARHLDVLSAWRVGLGPAARRPIDLQVMDLLHCEIPDLALRAHRDGVPTACWYHASPTRTPHWLLAVPGFDGDRRAVVGVSRRRGYYYRFSASEAGSLVPAPALV